MSSAPWPHVANGCHLGCVALDNIWLQTLFTVAPGPPVPLRPWAGNLTTFTYQASFPSTDLEKQVPTPSW